MPEKELYELKIAVKVDKEKADVLLKEVTDKVQTLGGQVELAGKQAKEANSGFTKTEGILGKLSNAVGFGITKFLGLTTAISATISFIRTGIKQYEEQIEINRKLESTVRGLGLNYNELKNSIDNTLNSLISGTRFTKDESTVVFSELLKLTGDINGAFKLLKIAMDVSVGTGKSLNEVLSTFRIAVTSGKDATVILAKEFGKLGTQGKDLDEMLTNLGKAFEGSAKSEQSLTKETTKLREEYLEFAKEIGRALAPAIHLVLTPLKGILATIETLYIGFKGLFQVVANGFAQIGVLITAIVKRDFNLFIQASQELKKDLVKTIDDTANEFVSMSDRIFKTSQYTNVKIKDATISRLKDERDAERKIEQEREALLKKFTNEAGKQARLSYEEKIKYLNEEVEKAKKLGIDRQVIEKYYQTQLTEITREEAERRFNVQKEIAEKQLNAILDNTQKQFEALNLHYKQDLENYKMMLEQKKISEEEYNQLVIARTKEYEAEKLRLTEEFVGGYKGEMDKLKEFTTSMVSSMTNVWGNFLHGMIKGGRSAENAMKNIFKNILNAFVDTLIRMEAEAMARAFLFSILGVPTGGGFLAGIIKGIFQTGGSVPETGTYLLHKGEKVIPANESTSIVNNQRPVSINLNVNAWDLRQLDRVQIDRIARQLVPILRKELAR